MKGIYRNLPVLLFVIIACCFITFQITLNITDSRWKSRVENMLDTGNLDVSSAILELTDVISDNYFYETNGKSLASGAMNGIVDSLPDRFSMYMDEQAYNDYLTFENTYSNVGVGVSTLYDSTLEGIYVVNVYKGSVAEQAGVVPGDIITHVNGKSVKDIGFYGAMVQLSTGKTDTEVLVTLKKTSGKTLSVPLSRSVISAESITGEKLSGKIGLIKINNFRTGDEELFKTVMEGLIVSDCEKFVLDVRNNHGGNIETISRILDFLLREGTLFTVTDKSGATNTIISDTNASPYPLAVLINKGTICGAEVFASTLGKFGQAKLVGSVTYGKASNQSVFTLSSSDAVSLSTTLYYCLDGTTFDKTGIIPDIEVNLSDQDIARFTMLKNDEDAQLQAAIEYLKTQKDVDNHD